MSLIRVTLQENNIYNRDILVTFDLDKSDDTWNMLNGFFHALTSFGYTYDEVIQAVNNHVNTYHKTTEVK